MLRLLFRDVRGFRIQSFTHSFLLTTFTEHLLLSDIEVGAGSIKRIIQTKKIPRYQALP